MRFFGSFIFVALSHPLNADLPMAVIPSGSIISSSALSLNAFCPISVTVSGNANAVRLLLFWNAMSPIFVSPSGMFIFASIPHRSKSDELISVSPSGRCASARLSHTENALLPSDVTELGMSTAVSFLHQLNADEPMLSSLSLNTTSVIWSQ